MSILSKLSPESVAAARAAAAPVQQSAPMRDATEAQKQAVPNVKPTGSTQQAREIKPPSR